MKKVPKKLRRRAARQAQELKVTLDRIEQAKVAVRLTGDRVQLRVIQGGAS